MLQIKTFEITPFVQNSRLLIDSESGTSLIIDPGGDVERLVQVIDAADIEAPSMILLTHAHLDHAGGVKGLQDFYLEKTGRRIELFGHKDDAPLRSSISQQGLMFGFSAGEFQDSPEPDTFLSDGAEFELGSLRARVLHTPGHAPGHIALYFAELDFAQEHWPQTHSARQGPSGAETGRSPILIAGDTLFQGCIARTDLPGGNTEQLLSSIETKIFSLDDSTRVLSGHGPDTFVGVEKRTNPFFFGRAYA